MVNNNTSQNTTVSTVVKSESSIYLKKSDLPKNISSFKNDVGYISTSTLDAWLKEHSYLSKSEVNALIKKANLVVLDTVNKDYDDEAIGRLNNDIINIKGEIVAIKDRLGDVESGYITVGQAGSFATKTDIRSISDRITELGDEINNINVDIDTSNFATKDEIPTKLSELRNDSNFITSEQAASRFVRKSEVPSVDGFATQEWVLEQGFLTETGNLKNYVKKSEVTNMLSGYAKKSDLDSYAKKNSVYSKNEANNIFLTKTDAGNAYLKKTDAESTYLKKNTAYKEFLKIEDYRGLKDATVISDTYKDKTMAEFEEIMNETVLRNGFYIVNGKYIALVKNNEVMTIFEDGGSTFRLEWVDERTE